MTSLYSSNHEPGEQSKPSIPGRLLALGLIAAMGLVMAYLATTGNWRMAIAIIALPVMIVVMHRYPFFTMTVWLLLDPFLLTSTTASERAVYWVTHRALPPLTIVVILLSALLGISKRGDTYYLRTLLIHGARSVMCHAKVPTTWQTQIQARRPANVAAVALATSCACWAETA